MLASRFYLGNGIKNISSLDIVLPGREYLFKNKKAVVFDFPRRYINLDGTHHARHTAALTIDLGYLAAVADVVVYAATSTSQVTIATGSSLLWRTHTRCGGRAIRTNRTHVGGTKKSLYGTVSCGGAVARCRIKLLHQSLFQVGPQKILDLSPPFGAGGKARLKSSIKKV